MKQLARALVIKCVVLSSMLAACVENDPDELADEQDSTVGDPFNDDAPGPAHVVELPAWDQAGVTNYYIAPDGDDAAPGTANKPSTLAGLQTLLANRAADPNDVLIHVLPGDYVTDATLELGCKQLRVGEREQGGRRTIIMPWQWRGGAGYASLPVPTNGYPSRRPRFLASKASSGPAIALSCADGVATNLEIYYLSFQHYLSSAVHLGTGLNQLPLRCATDGAAPSPCWNSANTVEGCVFYRIGDKYWSDPGKRFGYAAIKSNNSHANIIRNNLFVKIRNRSRMVETPNHKHLDAPGLLHGIYLFEFSSDDLIEGNLFDLISGVPLKLRSSADRTIIRKNAFGRTAAPSAIADHFQIGSKADGHRAECSSRDLLIEGNHFDCSDSMRATPLFDLISTKEDGYRSECDAHDSTAPRLASGSQPDEVSACGR